tara:strand:- start:227 stop:502 length:276 start_codon:yes stop_codon:yes gene_type:complete
MEEHLENINFEIALKKITKLTKHNNQLIDKIEELESKLNKENKIVIPKNINYKERFKAVSKEADAAIARFTNKLRKEIGNAKSKQSKRQSV